MDAVSLNFLQPVPEKYVLKWIFWLSVFVLDGSGHFQTNFDGFRRFKFGVTISLLFHHLKGNIKIACIRKRGNIVNLKKNPTNLLLPVKLCVYFVS